MFLKILMGFVFLGIVLNQAFATGPGAPSIEGFVAAVSKKTGMPPNEVRARAIEALRQSGRLSREDLERIAQHEGTNFDLARENEMVALIQKSASFRVSTGLESIRLNSIRAEAEKTFDHLAQADIAKDLRNALNRFDIAKLSLDVTSTLIVALKGRIAAGTRPTEALAQLKKAEKALLTSRLAIAAEKNDFFFAVTSFLVVKSIPFKIFMLNGRPLILIDVLESPGEFQHEVEVETLTALQPDVIIPRPDALIDVATLSTESHLDIGARALFLGSGFLRRVN